jgi:WhiB family transcriptional regulator, redox-sensing transcriptional regulator
MYGPGTAAGAAGTAGFEAVSASQSVRPGATTTVLPMARNGHLPCTDDPELFFAESPEDLESAKALCAGCAARMACLAGALERREPWGVWGGELFLRGEIVPRKRPRGRPRKTGVAA